MFPENQTVNDGPDYRLLAGSRVTLEAIRGLIWAGEAMGLYSYPANLTIKDGNLSTALEWDTPDVVFTDAGQIELTIKSGRCHSTSYFSAGPPLYPPFAAADLEWDVIVS